MSFLLRFSASFRTTVSSTRMTLNDVIAELLCQLTERFFADLHVDHEPLNPCAQQEESWKSTEHAKPAVTCKYTVE